MQACTVVIVNKFYVLMLLLLSACNFLVEYHSNIPGETVPIDHYSGLRETHYKLGSICERVMVQHGWKEGPMAAWHPNGAKCREGNFARGKRRGRRREWWPNNVLKRDCEYRLGELVGLATLWREDGTKEQVIVRTRESPDRFVEHVLFAMTMAPKRWRAIS
jgi:hypothetical protein